MMTDVRPPAPQSPPVVPSVPPVQLVIQVAQQDTVSQLNGSHFKPEYEGKTDEDAETHIWMDTDAFQEGVTVQRFCLTLVGKTRLWYDSLRQIVVDWNHLQSWFRQQYSK